MFRADSPTIARRLSLALVAGALALPGGAFAQGQDLRSPDARDAAARTGAVQDLRSPDTRDAASSSTATRFTSRDLRSPDARDAARGVTPGAVPLPIAGAEPVVAGDGFDWADAGIGAGVVAALLTVASGGVALARHRRGAALG